MPNDSDNKYRLRDLITRRSSAKGQITKFRNYLNSVENKEDLSNIQLTELNLKLAKFESLSVKVDDLQNDIEVLNPENISEEIDERDNIERDIIVNIATAKTLLKKFTVKLQCENRRISIQDNLCCDHQEVGLKLPQIQIAKFDGAYFRWLEFRDTFENLIHNNTRILPIHKFHYLISYLEGDALRIISNLEVSSVNYSVAWKLLYSRFNNKRILINHHLNSLFNMKQLPRESEKSLRFLVDHVTKNLRALASLGQPTDKWDVLIIFMLSSKLDGSTLAKWEEHRSSLDGDTSTLDEFNKFLIDRADVLESLNRNKVYDTPYNAAKFSAVNGRNNPGTNNNINKQASYIKSFASSHSKKQAKLTKSNTSVCVICNENHKIYDCPSFSAKSIEERIKDVRKYKLCENCLRQGHPVSECRIGPCRVCNKRHNSLIHLPTSSFNQLDTVNPSTSNDSFKESPSYFSNQFPNQIILSTAVVEVLNPLNQQKVKVRALLDCGSQSSFISKSLKDKLSLKSNPINSLKVIGIGNNSHMNVTESCNIQMKSLNSNFNVFFSCLVLNELTGHLPKYPIDIRALKVPKNIILADPKFYEPAPIDLLIGADIFWDIIENKQSSLGSQNPKLRSSCLGWIISGPINSEFANKGTHCNHASISTTNIDNNIDNMLTKFWALEEIPEGHFRNSKDNYCEKHFITHTFRDNTGRFCVTLPKIDTPDCLGDTYNLAKKRFHYLERRFKKNPLLKLQYSDFIREYEELGHLSPANDYPDTCYYLCHHAVLKQDSESTKLRVVFDGSAPSSSGYALNDILMVGPNIQDSLFSILIRARQYKFILTGDIEKCYRQVLLIEKDRNLQRILWRRDESHPVRAYKLNTLTYGTASASYLSIRCIWELGEEQDDELIKTIIQRDFWVDDLITGADSEQELNYIQSSITKALESGCFHLRKFKSNNPLIFQNIDINKLDNLTFSESTSTLGLGWTPSSDTLSFPVKNFTAKQDVITKRYIMSNSFKIFDPLGLLSPVIIKPKIMLQRLWQLRLDWDQPVPEGIRNEWLKFTDNLPWLMKLQIPRLVLCDSPTLIELHCFSDASQCAYGSCIYMKSVDSNGIVTVKLLCAKSKVAPLKPVTIPRLELCAALLSAKVCKAVCDSLRNKPEKIIYWCDSSVVLSWINSDLNKLKTFVANRAGEIIELTNQSSWRYVPTASNPADLISRGVEAKNLMSSDLWWHGPDYLKENSVKWPSLKPDHVEILLETKSHAIIMRDPIVYFDRYSSLNKLIRSFAYVLRFIFNLKHNQNKMRGILSIEELQRSFHALCSIAQRELFSAEYNLLSQSKSLSSTNKILSLSPFLDKDNLIRVGGRIDASACSYEKRHPILLHASHKLTKLYFHKQHIDSMHAGPQLLLATVRETVWPINGRHLARRTVNNCVRCRRLRGKTLSPMMGDLPSQRVNPDFPFLSVGLDFAGPFSILNRKGRGSRLVKCYLCLFVCLRYKCIHLEAVSDLSKDAFVMTLKRFIARRGKPMEIFCDNGRNFVAAAKEIGNFLKQNQEPICDFASQQGVTFKFIPTYAPHFGGIWEAGVKSSKHHLRRVMGNSNLTFEEISTLFAQVEAVLNSRPLCPLSSCPDDLLSLTPGHFIIGRPLTALPSSNLEDYGTNNGRKRYLHLEKIRLHFWKRWHKEYLAELQQRTKWRKNTARLNIGDMVLLAEDNLPPLSWRLGRVTRLFPGPDNVSRVADIKTIRGCVRRPLTRLCPLPTVEELQS